MDYKIGDEFLENNETLRMMQIYGIENVRGGPYTNLQLTSETINFIETQIRSINNSCYKCGQIGHFASGCPSNSLYNHLEQSQVMSSDENKVTLSIDNKCFACNNLGHYAKNCPYNNFVCYKCGQLGHFANKCTNKQQLKNKKSKPKYTGKKIKNSINILCTRCGRNSHTMDKCFASTHLNGHKL